MTRVILLLALCSSLVTAQGVQAIPVSLSSADGTTATFNGAIIIGTNLGALAAGTLTILGVEYEVWPDTAIVLPGGALLWRWRLAPGNTFWITLNPNGEIRGSSCSVISGTTTYIGLS